MVYVDDMQAPFGRYILCHMVADNHYELLAMLDLLKVRRQWIQQPGTYREHYDLSLAKRVKAVQYGAQEITQKDTGRIVNARRTSDGLALYFAAWPTGDAWMCGPAAKPAGEN